ncbi:hypothetical protein [Streptomyces sp. NPDC059256]|uniref:hypothetical protein n=1 Tax=Streptomyces sp. NPDC059256 TaxID=3346794 RepID=UPI00369D65B0
MHLFDTADLPDMDDWDGWLTCADRLTGVGDLRGRAIRLEHHSETGGGDQALTAAAYREVERQLGLDGLREDGSWRFTWRRGCIDEASFRLAADTRPQRRELVQRLLKDHPHAAPADPADAEQWEGALIDALLSHSAAHRLRTLDLHLTDYHRSAEHAAIALAARQRTRLERLYFGYDFDLLYEHSAGSTGNPIDPLAHLNKGLVQTDIWGSLPALCALELEGAFLFHSVDHDSLTRLRVRGPALADGSILGLGTLPGLVSLEVEVGDDVFGCLPPLEQLGELNTSDYPRLTDLDLSRAEFDATSYEVLSALAQSPVLPGLRRLSLRELTVGRMDCEGDPVSAAGALAPRFAHLDLRVDGAVDLEGTDDEGVDRALSLFGLSRS